MNVTVEDSGCTISWKYNGRPLKKKYNEPLMGYEILPDNSGILLLEPHNIVGNKNAVIYDLDGSERWRLNYTKESGEGQLFDRVGLSNGELIVVAIISNRDVLFVLDINACNYLRVSTTR